MDRVIGHALFGTRRTDNTVAAIKDSFVNTDAEFIAAHGARDTSGTTAVIAIVDGSVGRLATTIRVSCFVARVALDILFWRRRVGGW